uniref:Uncharacterized protein n=1 Tax=Candidatus Kentrum sp. FW TaxID=2126338 RepID=A0A450U292_9GAMM|nr:MAG: hypothetical protein BECKFW1821C_GA0114237_11148 [Candidatus Kentron sp. FW]
MLAAGTRYIWVVRLMGPQRVEVHTKDAPMRILSATDTLEAPGILRNPVPVQALFDRKEAHRVTLRNLLQREGYEDLEAVLREGRTEGGLEARVKALFSILAARGLEPDARTSARIRDCRDPKQLDTWLAKAAVADKVGDVF